MPTVLRIGPYRFFFYSGDKNEPEHIHVERDNNVAKFWLSPIRLQNSGGFNRQEINRLHHFVRENQQLLIGKWYEYFND